MVRKTATRDSLPPTRRTSGEPTTTPHASGLHNRETQLAASGHKEANTAMAAPRRGVLSRSVGFASDSVATQVTETASPSHDSAQGLHISSAASPSPGSVVALTRPKRVRIKTERRREQCRKNQERYRNKLTKAAVDLEVLVQRLRLEVLQLEDRRRSLHRRINTRNSAMNMLVEYFRLFRYGLNSSGQVHSSQDARPSQETQIAFLQSNFHQNLRVGDVRDLDLYMGLTRRFSTLYDNLYIEMLQIQEWSATETAVTVHILQRLLLTISETTIRVVFPHLQRPENDQIKWKLLGQQIEFTVCGIFHVDDSGKVVELDWTLDFSSALEQVLTVEETAIVLEIAQVVRDVQVLPQASPEAGDDESKSECTVEYDVSEGSGPQPRRFDEQFDPRIEESASGDEEGYLIHDGKGNDFVMV